MPKQSNQTKTVIPVTSVKASKKVVEQVVEDHEEIDLEEEDIDVDEELDEVEPEAEELEDAEVEEEDVEATTDKKKSKKVEYVSDSIEETLKELLGVDLLIDQQVKYRKAVFKTYQKLVTKQLKQSKKRRTHTSDTPKEATGFVKAIPIPTRFVAFYHNYLEKDEKFKETFAAFDPSGETPRTMITRMIYHYIRENGLYGEKQDESGNIVVDKRTIMPDDAIRNLLSIDKSESIGFNNFQSYVTRLYVSTITDAEGSEASEDEQESAVVEVVAKSKNSNKSKSAVKQ
jgi:hypothetical protein